MMLSGGLYNRCVRFLAHRLLNFTIVLVVATIFLSGTVDDTSSLDSDLTFEPISVKLVLST
jgi:hypothetical protein